MDEKTGELPSFDESAQLGADELKTFDSQSVTLARAIDEAHAARNATLEIKKQVFSEIERFRAAMRSELKARKRKIDLHDILLLGGLGSVAAGIAAAYHWAYSLIAIGIVFLSLSVLPLLRSQGKTHEG